VEPPIVIAHRVANARIRPGDEAIERHRHVEGDLGHPVAAYARTLGRPTPKGVARYKLSL
jgi:hypothetical protein